MEVTGVDEKEKVSDNANGDKDHNLHKHDESQSDEKKPKVINDKDHINQDSLISLLLAMIMLLTIISIPIYFLSLDTQNIQNCQKDTDCQSVNPCTTNACYYGRCASLKFGLCEYAVNIVNGIFPDLSNNVPLKERMRNHNVEKENLIEDVAWIFMNPFNVVNKIWATSFRILNSLLNVIQNIPNIIKMGYFTHGVCPGMTVYRIMSDDPLVCCDLTPTNNVHGKRRYHCVNMKQDDESDPGRIRMHDFIYSEFDESTNEPD